MSDIEDILRRLELLEARLLAESPFPKKSDVKHFWDTNKSFSQIAEHLMKISLYPSHRDLNGWKISVFNQLVLILRKTSDRAVVSGEKKSRVRKLHKTSQELERRISKEINNVFDDVQEKMAPSVKQRRLDVEDFNTISELGFSLETYKDSEYGWNYRILGDGKVIADTNDRDVA